MHTDDEIEPIPVYVGYNTTGQEDPAPVPVVTTSSLPKTGDSTNADLMLIVFVASATSLVTMLAMNAKKGRKDKKRNRVIKRAKQDCIVATWEVSKREPLQSQNMNQQMFPWTQPRYHSKLHPRNSSRMIQDY